LRAGDDIMIRGTEDGYKQLVEFASGKKPWEFPEVSDDDDEELTAQEEAASINDDEEDDE
ncbi:MAG: potassium transporter TrkA, partial [Candidatus Methanoplasma sp.]|nr:potassium transporter TrkA [Candidatus Methanoplasma sp.]